VYQKTVLDNGLRVVTSTMPHAYSVCVGIFFGTGSRYESEGEAGISHFIEHLCFKGTRRRPTAKDLSEAIEGVGGLLNGGTDKELTVYWCKVARPHFALAIDVLGDMLSNSRFDTNDIERERQIIIEEINMSLDSPQQTVDMLIDSLVWPDHPMGRDVAGSKATVSGITREDMLRYLEGHYAASNMVVSIAGGISHEEALDSLERAFGNWQSRQPQAYLAVTNKQSQPRSQSEHRTTEQAHLCLALPGLSLSHPDRFVLDLINVILGEGMSSRLFIEIREKRGLAYAVQSYVNHHLDTGCLTVYAGVDPKRLNATVEAILEELRRLTMEVPEADLTKAKELSKGRLLLRMEDTRSVAGWLGGQQLLLGEILTVDQVVSIVDSIRAEDLLRVAQETFVPEKLSLAVVGPVEEGQMAGLLKI
jgi:predicted Zn-dependent peptidase